MPSTSYRADGPLSLLICSTPVHGHVVPLLAVARTLVAQGHEVRFLTGARYRSAVEGTGARWVGLPREADYDDSDMDRAFPERSGRRGVDGARWDLEHIFLAPAPAQLSAIDEQLRAAPVDAVLVESLFLGGMLLLCRPAAQRPPVLNLGIVPLGLRSRDTAPFALGIPPMRGPLGTLRNRILNAVTDRLVFGELQTAAERMVSAVVGARLPTGAMNYPSLADAIVQFTVPAFEYPRRDLTVPVHFVGPVSLASASDTAEPDWWGDLEGRTVVHVTQGTVANADLEELVLPTMRALADEDLLVVASTGGRPVPSAALPANARIAPYLPYDRLFAHIDAVVTNGGYGGVHFALAQGVPVIAAGNTEDKAEVSARVAWSGAGLRLRPGRGGLPARAIRSAVRCVLDDPAFRDHAARIGAEIAVAPGPAGIESVVRGLLAARVG
ncbi:glycosyltransferase [Microbacterium hydrocarbonoxydans]|uniref:glycosyltransferase n=1 Tax=Microbacterium hydrocarbonoxydans TaxID=273678 RepID=UPI003D994842